MTSVPHPVADPRADRVTLRDGRVLEVLDGGPPGGKPLVLHHGTPGCALRSRHLERDAEAAGMRVISFSRAGYAGSDRRAGRSVADVASDVAELADRLGLDRFVTAGWSGGGPHALATAGVLTDRVAAVLVVAGVGPYDGPEWLAGMGELNVEEFSHALAGEERLRGFLREEAVGLADADVAGMISELSSLLPEADQAVLEGEVAEDLVAALHASVDPVDGWVDDDLAFTRPWGFDLEAVAAPAYLWQGEDDLMVPAAHAERVAARLPRATVRRVPGEGHLSLGVHRGAEMFAELAGTL